MPIYIEKVRFETSSAIHLYRYGIPDTTQYSQSTTGSYGIPTLENQTISNSDSCLGSNFPFSCGETRCCSRLSSSGQTSDVSVVSLETSYTSFGSSNFYHEYFILSGGWITVASFREHTSILQIPIHSSIWMPAIMDGVLISNL